jgi:solute carrier family 25 S-adenosylmethionine transporter 26
MFKTTKEAFLSILRTKGIAGFYQGYLGGVARDVPFRVAQLTSYEVTKKMYLKAKARRRSGNEIELELSALESAMCGALAGTFAAAVTAPLDRIKTMLMTNGEAYGGSVIGCATKIISEEGLAGKSLLYIGLSGIVM